MYIAYLLLGAGGVLFFRTLKNYRLALTIQALPRSKSETAPQGLIEIEGFASGEAPSEARKLSSETANFIFCRTLIQYKRPPFFGGARWKTLCTIDSVESFLITDERGVIRVRPHGGETLFQKSKVRAWKDLSLGESSQYLKYFATPPIPILSRFFAFLRRFISMALISPAFFFAFFLWIYDRLIFAFLPHYPPNEFDKSYRVVETWIEDQSPLYVIGYFHTQRENHENRNQNIFGEVIKKEQNPLFIGDGFENQVVEKLKSWMVFKFVLSGLLIFGGVYLISAKFNVKISKKAPVTMPNPGVLHSECVAGLRKSCEVLIDNQKLFNLPADNLHYYQKKLDQD